MTLAPASCLGVRAAAGPAALEACRASKQKRGLCNEPMARLRFACTDAMKPVLFKIERIKEA